ncbi:hypothetical protein HanPSC8_Chr17g0759391 [Helianthus annuus]|nr:hypothetical protein HanPSC8_Chr17g0759391 [Helianthus annuus]
MTFLNDSSDCSMPLLEAMAAGEDNFFVWVTDRRLDLAWWCKMCLMKQNKIEIGYI